MQQPNQPTVAPTPGSNAQPSISGFEITGMLGSGGMSTVYVARQTAVDRLVAIKVLHQNLLTDSNQLKRFRQEAKLATELDHPNIASVYSLGLTSENQPFIAMEYCEGKTLRALLDGSPPPSWLVIKDIFLQICAGLAHAHSQKIIHRDLKPSNIFVATMDDGSLRVKIIDFGLAKLLTSSDAAHKLTATGTVMGTPSYMSPEQCTGAPVDERSDLYSLGCMLFEAITGRVPFEGTNTFEVVARHVGELPTSLSTALAKKVCDPLEKLVSKALAKRADDRMTCAAEFAEALHAVPDNPIGPAGAALDRRQRWYAAPAVLAAALIVPAAAAVAIACLGGMTPQSRQLIEAERLLDSGNYVDATPKLIALQKQRLSEKDATKLLNDLCDLVSITEQDYPPAESLGLHAPKDYKEPVAARVIAEAAIEPTDNQPSPFARAKAVIAHASVSAHPEIWFKQDSWAALPVEQQNFIQAKQLQLEAGEYRWWPPYGLGQAIEKQTKAIELLRQTSYGGALIDAYLRMAELQWQKEDFSQWRRNLLAALPALPLAFKGDDRETARALVEISYKLTEIGHNKEAEQCLSRAGEIYKHKCSGGYFMAYYWRGCARVASAHHDYDQATADYLLSLKCEKLDHRWQHTKMETLEEMADCAIQSGKMDEAVHDVVDAITVADNAKHDVDDRLRWQARLKLAGLFDAQQKTEAARQTRLLAIPFMERECAHQLSEMSKKKDEGVAGQYHFVCHTLATMLTQLGRDSQSEQVICDEVSNIAKACGECQSLGIAYLGQSLLTFKPTVRESSLQHAGDIAQRLFAGSNKDAAAGLLAAVGVVRAERGQYLQALPFLEQAEPVLAASQRQRGFWEVDSPFALANTYVALGRPDEAMAIYRKVMPQLKPGDYKNKASVELARKNYQRLQAQHSQKT